MQDNYSFQLNVALHLICISCRLLLVKLTSTLKLQWGKRITLSHPLYEGLHLLWCWLQESCHWCTLGNQNPWPYGFHCNWKTHDTNNVCQTSWVMIICSKLRQNICSWLQPNYHAIKISTLSLLISVWGPNDTGKILFISISVFLLVCVMWGTFTFDVMQFHLHNHNV